MRLRDSGADLETLNVNYCSKVRSIVEYGGAVWGCIISGTQAKKIETCQIQALQIILGSQSSSYEANLTKLGLERLSTRRREQIRKFAISTYRDPKHRVWYTSSPLPTGYTRQDRSGPFGILPRFVVPKLRTERSDKIPLVTYTNILNSLTDTEWSDLNLPPTLTFKPKPNLQLNIYSSTISKHEVTETPITPSPPCEA